MEQICVIRKQNVETKSIQLGDQLSVELNGFGEFTATAHKITDDGVLFIFDECVARMPMKLENMNEGGFEASDLKKWMDAVLLNAFPKKLGKRITQLTLPTCGEIFGRCDGYERLYEDDNDERLPLMKNRKNRICAFNGDFCWWWLRNATKQGWSSACFAGVSGGGGRDGCHGASTSHGVRPEFWLIR